MNNINGIMWRDVKICESTNTEVFNLCHELKQPCIITAETQTKGRGRRGHGWISEKGNLFMSMAFKADVKDLSRMVIISGIAVLQTVKCFCPGADVKLKWPNDVLVGGAKISGILFERGPADFWIMGVGINVVSHPDLGASAYTTAGLNALGAKTDRIAVLKNFIANWNALLYIYRQEGFAKLKQIWQKNAFNLNKPIVIKQENNDKSGIFAGIDDNGCLLLQNGQKTETVIAGDMFAAPKEEKDE